MVSVTALTINIAGNALSDPGALSESHLSSLPPCHSLCMCFNLWRGSLGSLHAASATHHVNLQLCNAFMPTNPLLEVMMPVAVRRDSLSGHICEQEPPASP